MVDEAQKLFPDRKLQGPDFVWYTLGGNDFANHEYQVRLWQPVIARLGFHYYTGIPLLYWVGS